MPNIKSAAKRVRQCKVRTARNATVKSRVKTFRKRIQAAVEAGDAALAKTELAMFSGAVDKAAKVNVIHKNAAARYKSSMARVVASVGS